MKRTIWVATAALVVAASAACIPRPLSREKFQKIELDMTEADVVKIVGKPDRITKMNNPVFVPREEGMPETNQVMYAYVSGMEFAQVYFENGRVFGVRFNNEFLKGDWMEGERMPAEVLPPSGTSS